MFVIGPHFFGRWGRRCGVTECVKQPLIEAAIDLRHEPLPIRWRKIGKGLSRSTAATGQCHRVWGDCALDPPPRPRASETASRGSRSRPTRSSLHWRCQAPAGPIGRIMAFAAAQAGCQPSVPSTGASAGGLIAVNLLSAPLTISASML